MDKRVTAIVAYAGILASLFGVLPGLGKLGMFVPLIVWIVAYCAGDKNGAKQHLNQSLVLIILGLACSIVCGILVIIPIVRILTSILNLLVVVVTIVFVVWGLITAITGEDKKLPYIGDIAILK